MVAIKNNSVQTLFNNKKNNLSFKAAQINILATSDNHGHVEMMPRFYQTVFDNFDKIFPNKNSKSTLNLFTVVGDYFIIPKEKLFKSVNKPENIGFPELKKSSDLTLGHYQAYFLNEFVSKISEQIFDNKTTNKQVLSDNSKDASTSNFKTLVVPGNHCLESGKGFFLDIIKNSIDKITFIISNTYAESKDDKGRTLISKSTILEVPDDKDPNKIYKTLFLGVTPPDNQYTKAEKNILSFIDFGKTEKDKNLKATYREIISLVDKFKTQNPDGAIVMMSHMGNDFAKATVKQLEIYNKKEKKDYKIDLILNGHDHKDTIIYTGPVKRRTPIISLGENNEKFEAVKLHFDNDKKTMQSLKFAMDNNLEAPYNHFTKLLNTVMKADYERNISVTIEDNPTMKELSNRGVRCRNNGLINFMTDTILESLKGYYPNVEILGIRPTRIKGGLPVNSKKANNFDVVNIFLGPDNNFTTCIGQIKGAELAKIILENIVDREAFGNETSLIQWSNLQSNRKEIIKTINAENLDMNPNTISRNFNMIKLRPLIKIKNVDTGKYEPIKLNKFYTISLPLHPSLYKNAPTMSKHIKDFTTLPNELNYRELFYKHLAKHDNKIKIPDPNKDIRIID